MDRTGWVIQWPLSLLPDLTWIPGDEIFSESGGLLTTRFDEAPGSLFVPSDPPPESVKRARKRGKQKGARRKKAKGSA